MITILSISVILSISFSSENPYQYRLYVQHGFLDGIIPWFVVGMVLFVIADLS